MNEKYKNKFSLVVCESSVAPKITNIKLLNLFITYNTGVLAVVLYPKLPLIQLHDN